MQRKKTAIITARMTPGIKDLIQHQAKQAGMTVTDYIITRALEEAEAAEPVTEASPQDELEEQPEADET